MPQLWTERQKHNFTVLQIVSYFAKIWPSHHSCEPRANLIRFCVNFRHFILKVDSVVVNRDIRHIYIFLKRPGVSQRVGRVIALLFHDRCTRRWWVVSVTPQPHFTPGKDPAPILQEGGWAPGLVLKDGKSRPHRDSIPDRPARSQSLYGLSYPAHIFVAGSRKWKNTEFGLLGMAWCWYQVYF